MLVTLSAAVFQPAFSGLTDKGEVVSAKSLSGNVIVLTWWARWCAPCKAELEDFEIIFRENRSKGVEILAIDADFDEDGYRFDPFLPRGSFSYLINFYGPSFPLKGVPSTYILDRRGCTRHVFHRRVHLAEMRRLLTPLIAEKRSLEGVAAQCRN